MQATLIKDVAHDGALTCEEIFGPIMPVMPFDDDDDIFAIANDTEYGLSAYLYTQNLARALEAERRLLFGNILINETIIRYNYPWWSQAEWI